METRRSFGERLQTSASLCVNPWGLEFYGVLIYVHHNKWQSSVCSYSRMLTTHQVTYQLNHYVPWQHISEQDCATASLIVFHIRKHLGTFATISYIFTLHPASRRESPVIRIRHFNRFRIYWSRSTFFSSIFKMVNWVINPLINQTVQKFNSASSANRPHCLIGKSSGLKQHCSKAYINLFDWRYHSSVQSSSFFS